MKVLLVGVGGFGSGFQSGRPGAVLRAAEELASVDTLSLPSSSRLGRGRFRAIGRWLGEVPSDRKTRLLDGYSRTLREVIGAGNYDYVVSTTTLSFYRPIEVPSLAWPDAVLGNETVGAHDRYGPAAVLTRRGFARAVEVERRCVTNAGLLGVPTTAGIRSAASLRAPTEILKLPFGPNLDPVVISLAGERRTDGGRGSGPVRLVLNGVEWTRKGGPVAVETVRLLRRSSVDARLQVIGVCPPEVASLPFVDYIGRLNTNSSEDREKYVACLGAATALILPSQADNFGAVVAEAAAIGLPVIVSKETGAAEYVRDLGFGQVIAADDVGVTNSDVLAAKYSHAISGWSESQLSDWATAGLRAAADVLSYRKSLERVLNI